MLILSFLNPSAKMVCRGGRSIGGNITVATFLACPVEPIDAEQSILVVIHTQATQGERCSASRSSRSLAPRSRVPVENARGRPRRASAGLGRWSLWFTRNGSLRPKLQLSKE